MLENKKLFQHGTLGALMAGLYEGTLSIQELLTHGDMGIGTMDGLDGELIILDGVAYQGKSDGSFKKLNGNELVPYAAVTQFKAERLQLINEELSANEVKNLLEKKLSSKNVFSGIRVGGTFKQVRVRNMPKQDKPYPRLIEVSEIQPEYQEKDITGTIVGFYTPSLFQGAAAAGFHMHFISEARDFGGHVLDFVLAEGSIEVETIETLEQHFPTHNASFMEAEFDDANLHAEIEAAEG
ncbi:acetolactate decarboxylase [Carnobacterium gallinarum]|uniref:acetolactate decarboxylase n=1 Tax=Carnobacterium gallinarum TaxID=2749 RepID=UPI00055284DA|nr:acetolactate decarboxylase [Carnobacterium gallinarum]